VAAVLDRLSVDPGELGELRKRKTFFGERPLRGQDPEVRAQLPDLRVHAREFLEKKVELDAEARRREERLGEVRRDLGGVEKRLKTFPSGRALVQEAMPEILALEPSFIRALQLDFPGAMRSVAMARPGTRGLGLG
ncbi:MAG TPA: hypothetical protein VFQ76_05485, partial [Longimicrobiaceae bacterium]|nr:hypothetical protein [Longimicrobiaceae bacterium]